MAPRRTFRRCAGRLLRAAGTAVVVAVALAGAGLFVALGVLPHTGSYRTMTVLSGSMRPTIRPGSVVVVRRIRLQDVRPGDVVAFQAPIPGHPTVTHRITEVVRGGDRPLVHTKGDANSSADPWVAQLGPGAGWRVVTSVPGAGRLVHATQTPAGHRVVTLGFPGLFLVVWMASLVGRGTGSPGDPTVLDGRRLLLTPMPEPARRTRRVHRHRAPSSALRHDSSVLSRHDRRLGRWAHR
jgi:signal peptidase